MNRTYSLTDFGSVPPKGGMMPKQGRRATAYSTKTSMLKRPDAVAGQKPNLSSHKRSKGIGSKEKKGKIFVVSGPSGSGKTTLLDKLKADRGISDKSGDDGLASSSQSHNLSRLITVTTRSPRRGEKNGRDYFFVSQKEFLKRLRKGKFAEYQRIFGEYYATPGNELLKLLKSGKDVLLCVDVKGALNIKKLFPGETTLIFISAPDAESLKRRLNFRYSESKESLARRLSIAKKELTYIKNYDYKIVNDILPRAKAQLSAIITAERLKIAG